MKQRIEELQEAFNQAKKLHLTKFNFEDKFITLDVALKLLKKMKSNIKKIK